MTDDKPVLTKPALYCGTYGKYNDGSIQGKWLSLEDYDDAEEFLKVCADIHSDEDDPEFMFQDFEGFPRSLYSESLSLVDLEKIYEYVNLDATDRELVDEYADAGGDFEVEIANIQDAYLTKIDHDEDYQGLGEFYAEEFLADQLTGALSSYFDYEQYGRDQSHDLLISANGFVFRNY